MILSIIIPCFNEKLRLRKTIEGLINYLFDNQSNIWRFVNQINLCIVDDGSEFAIKELDFPEFDNKNINIYLLRHLINLGQGAALQTGVEYSRDFLSSDFYCTFDADGQHDPNDLEKMLNSLIKNNVDIVFGNRFYENIYMAIPKTRKIILKLAIIFEFILTGINVRDAHNGYRVFNKKMANLFKLKQARMAYATEIKLIVKRNNLKYSESYVNIQYSKESLEKGQRNIGAFKIIREIFSAYFFQK